MPQGQNPPRGFPPALKPGTRGGPPVPLKPRARDVIPLSPSARMKELLARPDVARLVRTTPVQDLFLLVKQVGLPDALELLELASTDQIQRMIDLDAWERDEIRPDTYGEWLFATVEAKGDKLKSVLDGLDPQPFIFFLQEHVKVHLIEPEMTEQQRLELEALNGVETPDKQYMIEFQVDDPYQDVLIQLVNRVYDVDVKEGHRLLEAVRWELPSQLEEEAYRLRSGRLEEIGYYDFLEALQVYAPVRGQMPARRERVSQPLAGPLRDVPLSLEHVRPSDGTLLSQALEELRRQFPDDDVTRDLMRVANKVLAADRLDPGELEDIQTALRQVRAYVNLGLELESGGEPGLALNLLRTANVEWLFRRGYTAAGELQQRARRLPELLPPRLRRLGKIGADSPYREVIDGLAQLRPLYYTGLERGGESGRFVPFQTRAQVERTAGVLDRIGAIYRFVFDYLAPGPVETRRLRESLSAMDLELTPAGVFLTSLSRSLIGEAFAPEPLEAVAFRTFLERAFVRGETARGQLRRLEPGFVERVQGAVEAFAGGAAQEEGTAVRGFVQEALEALRESYGALELDEPLELELVGGPIYLRVEPGTDAVGTE